MHKYIEMLSRNWLYCVNKRLNIVPNKVATGQIMMKVNVKFLFLMNYSAK